tara:strand:- start:209 stop:361 length:153 start_codon:yes stop_codon:yes gene_type:complete
MLVNFPNKFSLNKTFLLSIPTKVKGSILHEFRCLFDEFFAAELAWPEDRG